MFDDDDIIVATELIEKLEKDYKLKLCVTERDLVGGSLEFDAATRLITERCNRLIVIISPAFLESQANKFFLKFAQALGIGMQVVYLKGKMVNASINFRTTTTKSYSLYFQTNKYSNRFKLLSHFGLPEDK